MILYLLTPTVQNMKVNSNKVFKDRDFAFKEQMHANELAKTNKFNIEYIVERLDTVGLADKDAENLLNRIVD